MNQKILTIVLAVFLIGNYHVVTDWCDDLPAESSTSHLETASLITASSDATSSGTSSLDTAISIAQNLEQTPNSGHDAENDLCGHCGHLGLNIMQITPSEIDIFALNTQSSHTEQKTTFNSYCSSPPTRPPLLLS